MMIGENVEVGANRHSLTPVEEGEEHPSMEKSYVLVTDDAFGSSSSAIPNIHQLGRTSPITSPPDDSLQNVIKHPSSLSFPLPPPGSCFLQFRNAMRRLSRDFNFQSLLVLLILIDAIIMGIGTCDFVTDQPDVDRIFDIMDVAFLYAFSIEVVIQLVAWGWDFFENAWHLLDSSIVFLNWTLIVFSAQDDRHAFNSVQVLRGFHILRSLRLMSRVSTFRKVIVAFLDIMPHMTSLSAMLLLVFYIFSVLFTSLFKDLYKEGLTSTDYFSRIDTTFFTLFQIMTMDNWAVISREVSDTYWWAWTLFVTFVVVSAFVLVNVVIAVIFFDNTHSGPIGDMEVANSQSTSEYPATYTATTANTNTNGRAPEENMASIQPQHHQQQQNPIEQYPMPGLRRRRSPFYSSSCSNCSRHLRKMQEQMDQLSHKVSLILLTVDRTQDVLEKLSRQVEAMQQQQRRVMEENNHQSTEVLLSSASTCSSVMESPSVYSRRSPS